MNILYLTLLTGAAFTPIICQGFSKYTGPWGLGGSMRRPQMQGMRRPESNNDVLFSDDWREDVARLEERLQQLEEELSRRYQPGRVAGTSRSVDPRGSIASLRSLQSSPSQPRRAIEPPGSLNSLRSADPQRSIPSSRQMDSRASISSPNPFRLRNSVGPQSSSGSLNPVGVRSSVYPRKPPVKPTSRTGVVPLMKIPSDRERLDRMIGGFDRNRFDRGNPFTDNIGNLNRPPPYSRQQPNPMGNVYGRPAPSSQSRRFVPPPPPLQQPLQNPITTRNKPQVPPSKPQPRPSFAAKPQSRSSFAPQPQSRPPFAAKPQPRPSYAPKPQPHPSSAAKPPYNRSKSPSPLSAPPSKRETDEMAFVRSLKPTKGRS